MRRVDLGATIGAIRDESTRSALREIELASAEVDLVDIASAFTIGNSYTETRTLNVGTSTLAQTQAFIATFIDDLKRGGQHRNT